MDTPRDNRTYYEILGVSQNATLLELEAAMERKKREYEPEKVSGLGAKLLELAQAETDLIRTAFDVLKDQNKRKAYDAQIARSHQIGPINQVSQPLSESEQAKIRRAEIVNDRAINLWERGRYDAAIEVWEHALSDELNSPEVHNNLGNAYAYRGEIDQAIECLSNAIALDPSLVEAHDKLARIYQNRGDAESAIYHWQEVLRVEPTFEDAIHNLNRLNADQYNLENIPEYREEPTEIIDRTSPKKSHGFFAKLIRFFMKG